MRMKNLYLAAMVVLIAAVMTAPMPAQQPTAPQQQAPPAQGQQPQGPDMNAYYMLGPDSQSHEGVPKGEMRGPFTLPSQVYTGTQHTYWVYVPAQYDRAVPASLMIFNDGQAFKAMDGGLRAPNVLDNLIYRRE